jgi:hypothetical protein
MRRPLDWVVVGISILFLVANLPPSERRAQREQGTITTDFIDTTAPVTEFGYVRADGSFLPLAQEPVKPDGEGASFTSTWPSWR